MRLNQGGRNVESRSWFLCWATDPQPAACLLTFSNRGASRSHRARLGVRSFSRIEVEPLRLRDCPMNGARTDRTGGAEQGGRDRFEEIVAALDRDRRSRLKNMGQSPSVSLSMRTAPRSCARDRAAQW